MTISPTAFADGLYTEHLEEISFLYEQRMSLLDDPQIQWTDIGEFESRLEAHLDALVVGGQAAIELCLKKAQEGDFGERYGALRLLCIQDQADSVKAVIAEMADEDPEILTAAGDALKVDMPAEWVGEMMAFINADPAARIPILSRVLGFRRFRPPGGWADLLSLDSESVHPELLWALGRIREPSIRSIIQPYLGHPDLAVSSDAALAMLRIGEPDTLKSCLSADKALTWSLIPLGIGGGPQHMSRLVQQPATPDLLIAMGLLGHIGAVDALLNHFGDDELQDFAAMALQMITGAGLVETILISEAVDEDELSVEEREKQSNEPTPRPVEESRGETVTRLSQDQGQWKQWWSKNHSAFRPDIRYRNGQPYSPSVLVSLLASANSPRLIRQMAYEELVVRYDADFAFETDMPVPDQLKAIAAYQAWIAENNQRFDDGKWYFSGRQIG